MFVSVLAIHGSKVPQSYTHPMCVCVCVCVVYQYECVCVCQSANAVVCKQQTCVLVPLTSVSTTSQAVLFVGPKSVLLVKWDQR